jgi:recombination protein RecT
MENSQLTVKTLFAKDEVKKKFTEMLGKKAQGFITSVLQIVSQNKLLMEAEPTSIYHSAAVAATLDLPLNNNLGFAYIVPYNQKQPDGTYKKVAQFQMGYKGFIQLSQRSGQFRTLNSTDVRQGEIKSHNRLTDEIEFSWIENQAERIKLPVIAYVAYFKLLNGFEKLKLMYVDEIKQHGNKYSKTYGNKFGLWTTDFDGMAHKTVTKLLLSKNAPLSIEMQKAIVTDQALINDVDGTDVTYVDHETVVIDKEGERVTLMIQDATIPEQLDLIFEQVGEENFTDEQMEAFLDKKSQLSKSIKKA